MKITVYETDEELRERLLNTPGLVPDHFAGRVLGWHGDELDAFARACDAPRLITRTVEVVGPGDGGAAERKPAGTVMGPRGADGLVPVRTGRDPDTGLDSLTRKMKFAMQRSAGASSGDWNWSRIAEDGMEAIRAELFGGDPNPPALRFPRLATGREHFEAGQAKAIADGRGSSPLTWGDIGEKSRDLHDLAAEAEYRRALELALRNAIHALAAIVGRTPVAPTRYDGSGVVVGPTWGPRG